MVMVAERVPDSSKGMPQPDTCKATRFQPKIGDVVIVKTENKNPGSWLLAIVNEVYPGKDGIICPVRLKITHGMLE